MFVEKSEIPILVVSSDLVYLSLTKINRTVTTAGTDISA
jgi:GTP:adenosylcobinamide-phosphate guanylyltransferase